MVNGIYFLHSQKPPIIHGNLKPTNIFIDDTGTIKVAEFGIPNVTVSIFMVNLHNVMPHYIARDIEENGLFYWYELFP